MIGRLLMILICCSWMSFTAVPPIFITQTGTISFKSDAPLELIQAESGQMGGAIDTEKNQFAFSLMINTFQGFNSPLQQEHFQENYLETKRFPKATFVGKIIEQIDWSKEGTYEIRAKGKLNIHGVERERIIKSIVTIQDDIIQLSSAFTVLLADHDITIPKIVHQKIAQEIEVKVEASLEKRK